MENVKNELKQLTVLEKVKLFEALRDDLDLKTITQMRPILGKSYNGVNLKDKIYTSVGKTIYIVNNNE